MCRTTPYQSLLEYEVAVLRCADRSEIRSAGYFWPQHALGGSSQILCRQAALKMPQARLRRRLRRLHIFLHGFASLWPAEDSDMWFSAEL